MHERGETKRKKAQDGRRGRVEVYESRLDATVDGAMDGGEDHRLQGRSTTLKEPWHSRFPLGLFPPSGGVYGKVSKVE